MKNEIILDVGNLMQPDEGRECVVVKDAHEIPMIEHRCHEPLYDWEFNEKVVGMQLPYEGADGDVFRNRSLFAKWDEVECDSLDDFDTMVTVDFELAFDDGWTDGHAVVYGHLSIGAINDVVSADDIGIRVDGGAHEVPDVADYLADTLACLKGKRRT